jgi:glycosyltransferase involved in cell wall biosynthesis
MSSQPLVSVLIPVYNSEKFVADSLKSIISQTYQNLEILVLDDGSTDQSIQKVKSFDDSRIQIFSHEINQGLIVTRNELIEKANGKYIAFLDSDDISYPNRIQLQVDFLEKNSDFGMLGSNVDIMLEQDLKS